MADDVSVPLQWMAYALGDLDAARMRRGRRQRPRIVAFHAQQAAEKALKAALILSGIRPDRTHDLDGLVAGGAVVQETAPQELPTRCCRSRRPLSVGRPGRQERFARLRAMSEERERIAREGSWASARAVLWGGQRPSELFLRCWRSATRVRDASACRMSVYQDLLGRVVPTTDVGLMRACRIPVDRQYSLDGPRRRQYGGCFRTLPGQVGVRTGRGTETCGRGGAGQRLIDWHRDASDWARRPQAGSGYAPSNSPYRKWCDRPDGPSARNLERVEDGHDR